MLEARTFVKSFDRTKEILKAQNAIFKGEYEIYDIIFSSRDSAKTLSDEFLRLRIIPKNIWNEKSVIVAIKKTELKTIGKDYTLPFKKEFDSREEAQEFIDQNFLDTFQHSFEFNRLGWQYDLEEGQIDLEDIEGHLSIEIKSKTEERLEKLASMFNITDTIKGPSVVAVKKLLNL